MISLFKKIRKVLIEQNKISRYLAYALGEILLVVIGILIALQVNNWNEEKKIRTFEKGILQLLDQNLAYDAFDLHFQYEQAKLANTLTDSLLRQIETKVYDEQLQLWMGKIVCFERFKSQSSAYEVLKSKGFETIQDEELRLNLITYYDQTLFQLYQSNTDVETSFNNDWVPVIKEETEDFVFLTKITPRNPKEFFESPSTIVLFKIFQDNRTGSIRNMKNALGKISNLRELIKRQSL